MSAVEEYRRYMSSTATGRNPIALADAALAELEATIERLKVCGNCEHMSHDTEHCEAEEERSFSVHYSESCWLSPSRWAERVTS